MIIIANYHKLIYTYNDIKMNKFYINFDNDNDRTEYKINDKTFKLINGCIRIKKIYNIPLYKYKSNIQYYYQRYE